MAPRRTSCKTGTARASPASLGKFFNVAADTERNDVAREKVPGLEKTDDDLDDKNCPRNNATADDLDEKKKVTDIEAKLLALARGRANKMPEEESGDAQLCHQLEEAIEAGIPARGAVYQQWVCALANDKELDKRYQTIAGRAAKQEFRKEWAGKKLRVMQTKCKQAKKSCRTRSS